MPRVIVVLFTQPRQPQGLYSAVETGMTFFSLPSFIFTFLPPSLARPDTSAVGAGLISVCSMTVQPIRGCRAWILARSCTGLGQYEDDNISLTGSPKAQMPRTGGPGDNAAPFPFRARKVEDWTTLDLIASYTFNLPPPAMVANRLS